MADESRKTATPAPVKSVRAGTARRISVSHEALQAREEAIRRTRRPTGPKKKASAAEAEEQTVPDVEETECAEAEYERTS